MSILINEEMVLPHDMNAIFTYYLLKIAFHHQSEEVNFRLYDGCWKSHMYNSSHINFCLNYTIHYLMQNAYYMYYSFCN